MSWLEADAKPIVAGWGPEPQLHAPEIGSLVRGILENRLGQQKLTQDTLSEAIKAFQARQQASAFGSALQNAGVVPQGVDVSGMSSADLARLSQQIQEQTPDTDEDAMHKAAAARDQAIADAIKGGTYPYRGSGGRSANQVPLPDGQGGIAKDANGDDIYVNPNSVLYRTAMGAQDASFRTPMSPTQAKAYLANVGVSGVDALNSAQHSGLQQQPDGTLAPLTPNQSYDEDATHVKITPSAGGNAVTVPKAVLENVKKALMPGSYTDDTLPNQSPPVDVPPGGGTFPPNFSGFPPSASPSATPPPAGSARVQPNASTGAPVNPVVPNKPVTKGEQIDPATVQQYLLKNNNNPAAARREAQADGWSL